jgi:hypothetical protein
LDEETALQKARVMIAEALELAKDAKAAMKAAGTLPEARGMARTLGKTEQPACRLKLRP